AGDATTAQRAEEILARLKASGLTISPPITRAEAEALRKAPVAVDFDHTISPPPRGDRGAGGSTPLRYAGKTLAQWEAEFDTDISPERRTEAIRALSSFAARGLTRNVVQRLVQAMSDVPLPNVSFGVESPTERLKDAVRQAIAAVPREQAMPTLAE